MSRLLAIVPHDLAAGFSLTGIDTSRAESPMQTAGLILEAIGKKESGVIIITEEHYRAFDTTLRGRIMTSNVPTIIVAPLDMLWHPRVDMEEDGFVAGLVRSAVGYKLNIPLEAKR